MGLQIFLDQGLAGLFPFSRANEVPLCFVRGWMSSGLLLRVEDTADVQQ